MNLESTHLGKQSSYPHFYNPTVLVGIPRSINREHLSINSAALPFVGADVWHAYEFSFLLSTGVPVVGILKLIIPASSTNIIESKSLKLYLNSFNMTRIKGSKSSVIQSVCLTIKTDLEEITNSTIQVSFFDDEYNASLFDFADYPVLEKLTGEHLTIESYTENKNYLATHSNSNSLSVVSHLLRSNCKVTKQPDWGSVYIYMEGNKVPDKTSLLKYIISLRNENHFHEEICELIYKRLIDFYDPDELQVCCLYTRRGGIDINPVRSKNAHYRLLNLVQADRLTQRGFRQ